MIRKVIEAGHPNLKKKNKIVKKINSPEIRKLIKDLNATMYKTGLIGIASSQIGENYMIFVTHPRTTKARRLGKTDKLRVYINPKITFKSKQKNIIYEGCGSVASGSVFGPVLRPAEIKVEAFDERGNKFSLQADGILARVIQHEYDHLNGIEFIQKISDYNKIIMETYYKKTVRNSKVQLKNCTTTKIEYKNL